MGRKGEYDDVRSEYMKMVRSIMERIYPQNTSPRLVDYEQAVADYKTRRHGFRNKYTKRDVHTQVGRAIKELVRLGEVLHVGKYYYPADMYTLHLALEDFKKNVKVSKRMLAIISGTTYAISLEPEQDIELVKRVVRSSLGDKNVFELLLIDNVLVIIMGKNAPSAHIVELSTIVEKTYDYQHPTSE